MQRFEHGGKWFAHPTCVDFSANLNPLGMPAAAREALVANVDAFAAYPDPDSCELVEAIVSFEQVPSDWVVTCAGATDALARVAQVLRPREALVCAPCYSGYEQALEQIGAHVNHYALSAEDDFAVTLALPSAIRADCELVCLANPNNPTGRTVARPVLEDLLRKSSEQGFYVLLDECFVDLTLREGSNDLLASNPRLVIVKALTKSFCLAGLRVGYALCADPGLADTLRAAGQPWAVSAPAQVAGVASLADVDYLACGRELVARERERLLRGLADLGLRVIPGEANYLLFHAPRDLCAELIGQGVLVRSCANYVGLDERWHRVAVRTEAENDLLLAALKEVLG